MTHPIASSWFNVNTDIKIVKWSCIEFNLSTLWMAIRTSFKDDMGRHWLKDSINTLEKISVGQEKEIMIEMQAVELCRTQLGIMGLNTLQVSLHLDFNKLWVIANEIPKRPLPALMGICPHGLNRQLMGYSYCWGACSKRRPHFKMTLFPKLCLARAFSWILVSTEMI